MTLVAADVLTPAGEIDGALFYPSVLSADVSTLVGAYLTQGYANADGSGITDATTRDIAARRWAYYRAWSDVVNRLTITPASTSLAGEVSTTFLQSQIDQWITKRDSWLAAYTIAITPDGVVTTTGSSQVLPTRVVF